MVLEQDPNSFLNTYMLGSQKGGYFYGMKKK
jgi:hypothetical protein